MSALIRPRLIGRLGNNMFQIAACIGYAKKHGVKWGIKKGYIEKGFKANQVDKFFPNLPSCDSSFKVYTEFQDKWAGLEFNYHDIPFHPNGVEIVGFWQSEKYFENAKEEVRKAFDLPVIEGYRDYVSIHVRRGDYVQHSGSFPPVTKEYIFQAMQIFLDKNPLQKFIVFSDDIPWCIENIKLWTPVSGNESKQDLIKIQSLMDAMVEFSEGRNEYEDLCLMASCGHNIIANSSFSWWASWLNKNPDKIVISPSHKYGQWFGKNSGVKHDCVDLIPKEWYEIEFRKWEKVNDQWVNLNESQ